MTACPTCQKPVDTLRARSVGVRDGKVVAYCSAECAAKAGTSKPAAVVSAAAAPVAPKGHVTPSATPKLRSDFDSGPVIEITHEPASGVVTSAADPRNTPIPATRLSELKAKDATPVPAPRAAKITTEIDPREILDDDDDGDGDEGDDEIPDGTERADADDPGPATVRRRRDSFNVRQAPDFEDDEEEPADPVRARTEPPFAPEPERRGGKWAVVLLLLLALGGGGWAVYKYVYLPRTSAAVRAPDESTVRVGNVEIVNADAAPARAEPKAALDRAMGILRTLYESKDSDRLRRKVAPVLARTDDAAALDWLAGALKLGDLNPAGEIDLAYALARAGDKRGIDVLVGLLVGPGRDDRLTAAQKLVYIGNDRAKEMLAGFLGVAQNRQSAAEELARVRDPRAIRVLEEIRNDPKTNTDNKATATIALVVAGNKELVGEVRALLTNKGINIKAAEALADLQDEAARPTLVAQLVSTGLRVRAARALRRLAPDYDMGPYLATLIATLDDPAQSKDTEQIAIAEAILLLAGPARWADRP